MYIQLSSLHVQVTTLEKTKVTGITDKNRHSVGNFTFANLYKCLFPR